jgi:hypothetical protein
MHCQDTRKAQTPPHARLIPDSCPTLPVSSSSQFEARCRTTAPAQIMVFRFLDAKERALQIVQEAAREDALVVYTLVDPKV